ncbi:MAG: hypothetical protein AAGH48_11230 [Pseudomonadota bacterium]
MTTNRWRACAAVLLGALLASLSACGKKTPLSAPGGGEAPPVLFPQQPEDE